MLWKGENMSEKKRRSSVTISDVAQRAGVSRTAVSFVLNERDGERNKYVSEETRAKVWKAVEELHYQPHLLARTLRTGQSPEVAGILDVMITPLGVELTGAFQNAALRYGYIPTTYYCQGLTDEQRQELYQRIFARRPLAIVTTPFHFSEADVEQARANGIEYIIFYSFYPVPIAHTCTLVLPMREPGYLAARHLLERDYRHLVLVRPEDQAHIGQDYPFQQRLEGMREAIAEHPEAEQITLDIVPLQLSAQAALAFVEKQLVGRASRVGVYAFNDEYALFLLGALAQRGIRVPQEVGVVGTDDLSFAEGTWPPLTSINLDEANMGKQIAELLHALHQGEAIPEKLTSPLKPHLIQRHST